MSDEEQVQAGRLAEYNSLRAEIHGYQRDSLQILAFSGAASAAFFAFAAKDASGATGLPGQWWLFALLELLLIPAVILQAQRIRASYRIGRYIEACLETATSGLRWETRWMQLRRYTRTKDVRARYGLLELLLRSLYSFKWSVTLPIIGLQLASGVMMWLCAPRPVWTLELFTAALIIAGAAEVWLVFNVDNDAELKQLVADLHGSQQN